MSRFWAGFVGSLVEAWAELRIHKTRVLLSLIGVAVAVAAITDVAALGQIAEQSQREQAERGSGRPATIYVSAYNPNTGEAPDPAVFYDAFVTVTDRYDVSYTSRSLWGSMLLPTPFGVMESGVQAVDADFGTMHRVSLADGRWFVDTDANRLAPVVIVNEWFWEQLGSPPLATHPTITLPGEHPTTAVIIGTTPSPEWDSYPQLLILASAWEQIMPPEVIAQNQAAFEAWVPPELAPELTELIRRDIAGALGEGWQVDVSRQDYLAWGGEDPFLVIKLMIGGVAGLVLLLGALGLVNISLVTVKHRIREIGIRRSFGATGGRVFFSVMMESVVATFVAGVVGVMIAILLVKNQLFETYVLNGVEDVPPFPYEAALLGLAAAVAVGALAGILPAIVAVRVKVIDAIRY